MKFDKPFECSCKFKDFSYYGEFVKCLNCGTLYKQSIDLETGLTENLKLKYNNHTGMYSELWEEIDINNPN